MIQNAMIKQITKKMKLDQSKVDEVLKKAKEYGNSKEGFMQCVNQFGGIKKLEEMKKYKNNVAVKTALGFMGTNVDEVETMITEATKGIETTKPTNALDRLKKLR